MRGPNQPALDGFTIRRKGDAPTKVRTVIYLDQQPEQFKLHADLGAFSPSTVCAYMRVAIWFRSEYTGDQGGLADGCDSGAVELH